MSLLKRIVSVATILTVVLMVAGPAVRPVSALTVEELQAQIAALQEQLAAYQQQLQELLGEQGGTTGGTIEGIPEGFTFDRNLKMGMTGDDVKYLQILLNSDPDTKLADEGAGSPGNETTYFGPRTKAAVIKFQEKYADDVLAPWGLTHGTGFVGSTTRAKLNEILASGGGVTPPTPTCSDYTTEEECTAAGCYWYEDACHEEEQPAPTETGLTVALADDTPAAGVLVTGQGLADLAHFTFTNGDADEVKVTQLKVKRGGVSSDSAITYLYLYNTETGERLTDPVTLSSSYATFNDPTGLFTVPAGESVTVAVKGDIASGSGQIIQISIESADDVTSDATAVNGEFPLTGNQMSVASGTLAGVDFNSTTEPSGTPSIDPGETGYTVWKNSVNVSSRSVYLKYLRLKEIGSIDSDDLQNFKLYVNGEEVAGPVQMSDDFYVTFDLTSNPVTLETGTRILEVRADVIDGSGKSFSFSLWYTADIVLEDSQYNVSVIPTKGGGTFTPATTGTISIASGSLSIVRASDSPSGSVVINGSGVTLGKYTFTAYGERIKVSTLAFKVAIGGSGCTSLRNGKVFANGSQIGPTASLTTTGTTYSLGSSLIVEPGNPVTVEIKADIYCNDGTNSLASGNTIKATLVKGENNAQRMTSMTLLDAPESDKDAYTVEVAEGNLILGKNSAYGNQTTIAGKSNFKIGSYVLTSANEELTLNQFSVKVTASGGGDASDLTNIYVVYGDNQTTPKATAGTTNTFNVSYEMPSGVQLPIDIYADISSGATGTYTTTLQVSGTAKVSGNPVSTPEIGGQTITIGTAALTAVFANEPSDQLVVATEDWNVGKYKWTAQTSEITITDVYFKLVDPDAINSVVSAKLDLDNDGTPDTPDSYPMASVYEVVNDVNEQTTTITVHDGSKYSVDDEILFIYGGQVVATGTISNIGGNVLTITGGVPDVNGDGDENDTDVDNVGIGAYVFPFTGGSIEVPANDSITVGIFLTLNDVTTNGDSGDNVKVALVRHKWQADGSITDEYVATAAFTGLAANASIIRNTIPTVEFAMASQSGNVLNGQSTEIYKFTVAADDHKDVAIKQMKFEIDIVDNDAVNDDTLKLESFKLYRGSTDITDDVAITTADGATDLKTGSLSEGDNQVVVVRFINEEVIPAGSEYTYTLKATPSGFEHDEDNDYFTVVMLGDSSAATYSYLWDTDGDGGEIIVGLANFAGSASEDANFIWSDNSAVPHSYTVNDNDPNNADSSGDWTNGYLVENLDAMTTVTFTY